MVSALSAHAVACVSQRLAARARQGIADRVRIDTRSLALFRIALGLLIVADVALRSRNLALFYTDDGAVPASLAVAVEPLAAYSPYAVVTSTAGVAALFALTALVGVALALGYYTRPVTVLALILVVSLDARKPVRVELRRRVVRGAARARRAPPAGRALVNRRGRRRPSPEALGERGRDRADPRTDG